MWTNKSRRTIHNQPLIQLLLILAFVVPLPTVGILFWLIFGVFPSIAIPSIMATWVISATAYTGIAAYNKIREKQL